MPHNQGDAIGALNSRFYCSIGCFRFLPIYREFLRFYFDFFFFTTGEEELFSAYERGLHEPELGLEHGLGAPSLGEKGSCLTGPTCQVK